MRSKPIETVMPRHPSLPAVSTVFALGLALTAALSSAPAGAEAQKPGSAPPIASSPVEPSGPARKPYLSDALAPDTIAILPPPPAGHSAAEAADRAAFNTTRLQEGTPRWDLATADVADGTSALIEDFACTLGQRLDLAKVPALVTLLDRVQLDIVRAVRPPKHHYRRLRPFVGNQAAICVARDEQHAQSFSYPSGHASLGWAYAMIMASLIPEKATQFLVRGRLFGESRVVCGVHWMSDIVAARANASAVFAVLQSNPAYRVDAERARDELAKALAGTGQSPDAAICAREAAAAREPLF